MTNLKFRFIAVASMAVVFMLLGGGEAYAMHIMEGFLPPGWSLFWTAVSLPFFALGFRGGLRDVPEIMNLQ